MGQTDNRTVVIGLDGAHFELLQPWISNDSLPNIKHILQSGISGDLKSVIPPVTSPNWKAYSTGKNPGKLGIFWWENINVKDRSVYYPNERKHGHTEYWDILAKEESVGVLGVPTTYPPRPVGEFQIAGAPDGKNDGFAYPEELESELKDTYDYRVVADNKLSEHPDQAARELIDLIDMRFRVARDLFDEYDLSFLQVTTFYINTLQHYFWNGEYTREAWECIDSHIGEFLDRDLNVILMSDHGSTRIKHNFHINPWLQSNGYMSVDMGLSDLLHKLGVTSERLGAAVSRFGLRNAAVNLFPSSILRRIPSESGEVSKSGKAAVIDWDNSRVIASGQGPVYVLSERIDQEYESLRTELIEALKGVQTPDGVPVADGVYRSEEVYSGPYMDEAPGILIDQRDGIHISGDVGRGETFSKPASDGWLGENKRHGLFVASGPDFGTGSVEGLSILDLAPTILHLFSCSVPEDMDGDVCRDVFAKGSSPRKRTVEETSGDSNLVEGQKDPRDEAVTERLEDLGYL